MPASDETVTQIADILVAELGEQRAQAVARRLFLETNGNRSYEQTMKKVYQHLLNVESQRRSRKEK